MQVTYEFDPPVAIPPHGTAEINGGLEFCTVTVKDSSGSCLAFGRYQRVRSSPNKYKLISGTAYTPPKEETKV